MDRNSELEDLEALVASDGWKRFEANALKMWGPESYRQQASRIMNSAASTADIPIQLMQLETSTRDIEMLLKWPQDRIKKLRSVGGS